MSKDYKKNKNLFRHKTEEIALEFLIRAGHVLLINNYKKLKTEIDLITLDCENVLHATEVKGWSNTKWKHPLLSLTPQKITNYHNTVLSYVFQNQNKILNIIKTLDNINNLTFCFNLIWIPNESIIHYYPKLF